MTNKLFKNSSLNKADDRGMFQEFISENPPTLKIKLSEILT